MNPIISMGEKEAANAARILARGLLTSLKGYSYKSPLLNVKWDGKNLVEERLADKQLAKTFEPLQQVASSSSGNPLGLISDAVRTNRLGDAKLSSKQRLRLAELLKVQPKIEQFPTLDYNFKLEAVPDTAIGLKAQQKFSDLIKGMTDRHLETYYDPANYKGLGNNNTMFGGPNGPFTNWRDTLLPIRENKWDVRSDKVDYDKLINTYKGTEFEQGLINAKALSNIIKRQPGGETKNLTEINFPEYTNSLRYHTKDDMQKLMEKAAARKNLRTNVAKPQYLNAYEFKPFEITRMNKALALDDGSNPNYFDNLVTLVKGFEGTDAELAAMARLL